jgi:hypothetical protein
LVKNTKIDSKLVVVTNCFVWKLIFCLFTGKQLKPKIIARLSERVNRAVSGLTLTDSSGREREVFVRFLKDYAPDQNDWGEFQAHRKLLGLLTVASVNSQTELNEICRQHESLKVRITSFSSSFSYVCSKIWV